MLSKQEIAGLRKLLAKATPGPWECCDGPFGYQHRMYGERSQVVCEVTTTNDAALIDAMHNALPALLDTAEAALPVVCECGSAAALTILDAQHNVISSQCGDCGKPKPVLPLAGEP